MKKLISTIWDLIGIILFLIVFLTTYFKWLIDDIQPNNFQCLVLILLAISIEGTFIRKKIKNE